MNAAARSAHHQPDHLQGRPRGDQHRDALPAPLVAGFFPSSQSSGAGGTPRFDESTGAARQLQHYELRLFTGNYEVLPPYSWTQPLPNMRKPTQRYSRDA